ncbi:MAG: hypothetical protein KGZ79_15280 [Dethiobacter sp.]|jgi:hypothetical protein|nr:hypothetical protein [Dethiobacter sp.]
MRRVYLIIVIIVMSVFAYFVRAGVDRSPAGPQTGPAVAHSARGAYANCMTCHAGIRETHTVFGDFEDCATCHAHPSATPHAVDGPFADCQKCHKEFTETHDAMFDNYSNCLKCHDQE